MNTRSLAAGIASTSFRVDIQLLRSVAILLVIWHHARLPFLPAGFLGVDMFFVISGYLMTGLVCRAIEGGRFSFKDFYARRVRRLFPAAYATLAITAALAPILLDRKEFADFIWQLAGSFAFFVNFVLWRQSDYFSSGADLKPLLHMWSLAVEEQFYLGLPLVLFWVAGRYRFTAIAILTFVSGMLCVYLVHASPSAGFYLLPARAWELGVGALISVLEIRGVITARRMLAARAGAFAVIIYAAMLGGDGAHPGWPAVAVCIASGVLVVPGWEVRPGKISGVFRAIGDRSYSLYLVHWPAFAFANNVFIERTGLVLNVALLVICCIWAEMQFRYVEQRFRALNVDLRACSVLFVVMIIVVGGSIGIRNVSSDGTTLARQPNTGLNAACVFEDRFVPRRECFSAPSADVLVWGDSFAMHLVDGLASVHPAGVIQATKTVCGPLLGIAPTDDVVKNESWARSCMQFNDSVLGQL